jgi:type II secretory pathway pseudopilin PulG
MPLRLRGASLPELLVALVLLGLLGAALTRSLMMQRRAVNSALEREAGSRTIAQASTWLISEFLELGRGDSATDLVALAAESLSYRAYRSAGLACLVAADEVLIRRDRQSSWRSPQPGRDSLLLFIAPDSAPMRGRWRAYPITGVGTSVCEGVPAIRLGTVIAPVVGAPVAQVPVRTFETMQVRFYRSLGQWWLGGRSESGGEGLQPVTGPLAAGGLQLTYLDSAGNPTGVPAAVRAIRLLLVSGGGRSDSARLFLAPRNLQ